jgi:undecaprenyl-diphosphatase
MDILDSVLLGILQGLTEFLPVSSSGHLELGKALLGDHSVGEDSLLYTIVLHFATALSTIVVFRKDIYTIIKAILKWEWNTETQFTLKVILSMTPAVVVGLYFESELEGLFGTNLVLVGSMLILTALLLILADQSKSTGKSVSYKNAFIIGLAQAFAMLPGVSRSGATISTSVLLGNDKSKAARFSFLMVVPLIFGKIVKDLISGELQFDPSQTTVLLSGFIAAFISGLIACTWMIRLVKNSQLKYFAYYCAIIGIITLIITL